MIKKLFKKTPSPVLKRDLATDSGMLCVWDYQSFSHVTDYDSWDAELCEDKDILTHISKGDFVPLNLGDGAFCVDVRLGTPDLLNEREEEYLLVPSKPYKLNTTGKVCVSGLEHVGNDALPRSIVIDVEPGEYAVFIQLIDWNQEPGAVDESGNPTANALPDMIVFISDPIAQAEYRQEIETFRQEDALR